MSALVRACQLGEVPGSIVVVVSPVATSPALQAALEAGLDCAVVSPRDEDYFERLMSTMREHDVEWICLAGLMTKLPEAFVQAYAGRILNIHPALLPKFGGKGMYGIHVHEAVVAAGERESGCTVHVVTENYDEGPILLQYRCEVLPDDTPESLASRVLELEHQAFPRALKEAIERHAAQR